MLLANRIVGIVASLLTFFAISVPSFAEEKVVIPFDFVSQFDDGGYGEKVGDMVWQRLHKQGKFVIPETMLDVRDTCKTNGRKPSPERRAGAIPRRGGSPVRPTPRGRFRREARGRRSSERARGWSS